MNSFLTKYKKGIFILLKCFLINYAGQAQTVNAIIQNSTGASSQSTNGYFLTYSVGELASIEQFTATNNYILSTGLLQTFMPLVTALNNVDYLEGGSISIFPNPAVNYVQIDANFNQIGQVHLKLLDVESKLKFNEEITLNVNQLQKRVEIGALAPGVYYLQLQFIPLKGSNKTSIYKVVKL